MRKILLLGLVVFIGMPPAKAGINALIIFVTVTLGLFTAWAIIEDTRKAKGR